MISCINKLVEEGKVDRATADELIQEFNRTKDAQQAFANVKTKKEKAYKHQSAGIAKYNSLRTGLDDWVKAGNKPEEYINYLLTPRSGRGTPIQNVETTSKNIVNSVIHKHYDTLEKFAPKLFGNKAGADLLQRMVRQSFGEINDAEAKGALDAFEAINRGVYDYYAQSGGTRPYQPFQFGNDVERIASTPLNKFIEDAQRYSTSSVEDITNLHNRALAGEDIEFSVLNFEKADDYMQFAAKYGNDGYSSLINKLQKQATHAAMNAIIGPNSNYTLQRLMKEANIARENQWHIQAQYDTLMGNLSMNTKAGYMNKVTNWVTRPARAMASATMLGGATAAAVADLGTMFITAKFNNMPATKLMFEAINNLRLSKSKDTKKQLAQLGFMADDVISSLGQNRFDSTVAGGVRNVPNIAADKVLRASGLIHWSETMKNTWKLGHLAQLTNLPKTWNAIDPKIRKQFDDYGITKKDWEVIYNSSRGDKFLDVTKLPNEINQKVRKFVEEESRYAVLEPGAKAQAYLNMGTESGSLLGETVRTATQFKSFLLAALLTHVARAFRMDTAQESGMYAVKLTLMSVIMGAFVIGLKDAINGNDPTSRDMDNYKYWAEALSQGGGLGPLGDALVPLDYGESRLESLGLAGAPALSFLERLATSPKAFFDDKKSIEQAFGDVLRDIGKSVPGQNLWYAKAVMGELMNDMVRLALPDYEKSINERERKETSREKKEGLEPLFEF